MNLPEGSLFSANSLAALQAEPGELQECSLTTGWSSALLRIYRSNGESDAFDTPQTSDIKIVVNLDGQSELRCLKRGLWRTGVKSAGSVGMTPAGQTSRLRWRSLSPDGFLQAHLFMPAIFVEEGLEERRRAGLTTFQAQTNILAADDAIIANLVRQLVQGMKNGEGDMFAEELVRRLGHHLTFAPGEWKTESERDPGVMGDARLRRALEFMSADLTVDHSLEEIAREAGISQFHFVRLFRRATGKPPHAYLTELRLDAARRMLERSDVTVAEAARLVGYRVPRNFNAAFARRFGSSPGAWRRDNGTARGVI